MNLATQILKHIGIPMSRLLVAASLFLVVPPHGTSASGVQQLEGPPEANGASLQADAHPLDSCAYGVWHTEGVLSLFEYLRETRSGERPLRLAGIDVQPIGPNKADRPEFLSSVVAAFDADYASRVFALDSTFLAVYALDGPGRRASFSELRMAEAYDALAVFLGDKAAADPSTAEPARTRVLVARQTAASMAAYIRSATAMSSRERVENRDRGMAENLIFLAEELYPDKKIIVWGHNFHLRHDNVAIPPDSAMFIDVAARTMGSWIRDRYGDEVYTVGLYAHRGQAANNSGEAYEILPAEPGSLEALLHEPGFEALFIDLSHAAEAPGLSWVTEPVTARHNGTIELLMVPSDQYDAILLIDEATPRVMLY